MSEPKIRCISGSYANNGADVHKAITALQQREWEERAVYLEDRRSKINMGVEYRGRVRKKRKRGLTNT